MADQALNTTLCYLERDGCYLMLHRVKKQNDVNKDKWIGVGGKFEPGESPEDCLLREVREETGLTLHSWRYCGLVTFVCPPWPTEYMHLFTSGDFSGEPIPCDEGVLEWVPISRVPSLPIWQGDKLFLKKLAEKGPFFSLKLVYDGSRLAQAVLDGRPLTAAELSETAIDEQRKG